jgi:hypothetical protein
MPLLSTIGAAAARAFGFLRSLVTGGYNVANSLRFNVGSSDYLEKALTGVDGNRQIWTFSCWVKRSVLGTAQTIFSFGENLSSEGQLYFDANDFLVLTSDFQNGSSNETDMKFRDVGAWYHIVWACDSTQAINADRWKVYVNGTQVTLTGSPTITLNGNGIINAWAAHDCWIGANARSQQSGNPPQYSGVYLSETYFIDGQQKQASDFGETDTLTGIWKPKAYTGTFGTNGFYLKYANSAALGTDSSGNGNTFTANNLTSVDQSTDTPTNNFATLNPLVGGTSSTFTNGNLSGTIPPINGSVVANMAVNSGKWYCEFKFNGSIGGYMVLGVSDMSKKGWTGTQESDPQNAYYQGSTPAFGESGSLFTLGTTSGTSITGVTGTVYGLMWDADNSILKITDGTNTYQSTYTVNNTSTPISFMFAISDGAVTGTVEVNFGSPMYAANSYTDANGFGNFTYAVPAGFYALCTKNLAQYG